MDVRTNGEIIRKRLYELGDKTQAQIAERLDCDEGTARRILKGNPVRIETAEKVCRILDLDPFEVIILGSKMEELPLGSDKQATDTDELNPLLTDASRAAFEAADKAIMKTLQRYNAADVQEISNTLTALLLKNAMEIALVERSYSHYFVDDIYNKTKTMLGIWFNNTNNDG